MQEQQAVQEKARLDEEFKNPLKPEITEARGFMGATSAPITIVEYTDFQCPYCAKATALIDELLRERP